MVADNARKMMGKNIDISITSMLQTKAGKMIFGKFDERAAYQQQQGSNTPSRPSPSSANRCRLW